MSTRAAEIQAALSPFFENYGIMRAVLFGSFAKGTETERSDIDLLVESGLHGLRFVGFMEAVRQATNRQVDIFDVTHIEKGSRLDQEIQATGVTIYEAPHNAGLCAMRAASQIALQNGIADMTLEEINAEIAETRKDNLT